MTRQYYDDFSKLPLAKMAQAMTDMTFNYNETKVPTSHYKKQLGKGFEELIEANLSVSLVSTIFNTLQALQKESPKLFYQALLCLDTSVKPSNITASQYQAMEFTWSQFELNKQKHILDKSYVQMFNQVEENGLSYYLDNQETQNDDFS
ncbi:hypothetical protein EFN63_01680 [Leuconostoc citreum]|uniref:Uncharacterized protein n=1 Tax=Leuconostoc citreum TaxID=33964 RepID=A0A5A5U3S3_LEUCI|nr:hypothetical protein [Leuconostoc citreum]MCT3067081.1 hypothetical protein [Leuconostoc citreum]TDG65650.1 hypothetical protein C5L21_000853 [Leuconostoc citreum]GDZ84686.1 hypothetical protein LCIT_19280 [Leuconostoc citreum]GDZ85668.1 hypothetical protein LCTS_08670 [Leuconostoc citreum]